MAQIRSNTDRPYEPLPEDQESELSNLLWANFAEKGFTDPMENFFKAWIKALGKEFYITQEDFTPEYIDLSRTMAEKIKPQEGSERIPEGEPVPFLTDNGTIWVTNNEILFEGEKAKAADLFQMAFLASRDIDMIEQGVTLDGSDYEKAMLQLSIQHINKLRGGQDIEIKNAMSENDFRSEAGQLALKHFSNHIDSIKNDRQEPSQSSDTPDEGLKEAPFNAPSEAMGAGYKEKAPYQEPAQQPAANETFWTKSKIAASFLGAVGLGSILWLNSGDDNKNYLVDNHEPAQPPIESSDWVEYTAVGDEIIPNAEEKYKHTEKSLSSKRPPVNGFTLEGYTPSDEHTLVKPIDNYAYISGRFGDDRGSHEHQGTDFAAKEGTPIKSMHVGIVEKSYTSKTYGHVIIINNGTCKSTYAHMRSLSHLKEGDKVEQGKVVGYVGNTGRSRGNHLHAELSINETNVDLMQYLNNPQNQHAHTGATAAGNSTLVAGDDYVMPTATTVAFSNTAKNNRGLDIPPSKVVSDIYRLSRYDKEYAKRIPLVEFTSEIEKEAGLPPNLLIQLVASESSFDENVKTGKNGDAGILQITPILRKELGLSLSDAKNPKIAIPVVANLMKTYINDLGDPILAVVWYNAGSGALRYVEDLMGQKNITGEQWIETMKVLRAKIPVEEVYNEKNRNKWSVVTLDKVHTIFGGDIKEQTLTTQTGKTSLDARTFAMNESKNERNYNLF